MDEPADNNQPPKRKRKKRKGKKKPRGIHVVSKNDKQPFKYDARPVLAKHVGPGRPTGYNTLRGDELVAHMAGGLSLTAASAAMGFDPDTLREWGRRYPEFLASLKRGRACRTLYLERKLNLSVDGAAVTAAIFGLKNAAPDEWRDKHEVVTSTAPDDPLLAYLKSIDGRVLRPREPVTIEADFTDVTNQPAVTTQPKQIDGPPRPMGPV